MNYSEYLNLIKNGNLNSSYLFTGREEYLMNDLIERIKNKYIDDSFETLNFTILEGKNETLDNLINACETLPFMSEKKVVVLKDISFFIDKEDKNFEIDFYKHLDNLGEFLCLIIVDNDGVIRKNSKIYKYFNKKQQAIDLVRLEGRELNSWIQDILVTYNRKMNISNINYFIQQSSYLNRNTDQNLYDLENELLKVVNYSDSEEITKETIELVMIKSINTTIFQLLDAIASGNSNLALNAFNDLYILNEPIQKILFMVIRQMRLLLGFKLYERKGYNQREIQSKLQIKPYEAGKISNQSKRFSVKTLENTLEELQAVDKKLKTTSINDKLAMEMLIINICYQNK